MQAGGNYYPFGLTMAGLSTKASNKLEQNRYKFNGIEFNSDLDLDAYEAHFRNLDPQLGRWWQIDPKPNVAVSPYAAMDLNPIRNSDFLGDTSILDLRNRHPKMSAEEIDEMRRFGQRALMIKSMGRVKPPPNRTGFIVQASEVTQEQEPLAAFVVNLSYDLLGGLNSIDDFIADRRSGENSAEDIAGDVGDVLLSNISVSFGGVRGPNPAAGQGFKSFSAFKRKNGAAGPGQAWHHIVEQTPGNISKFGDQIIHNADNLVKLPHGKGSIHAKVSGYYSSIQPFTNGRTVRQWLSTQDFQAQHKFGIQILKKFNGTP